MIVAIARSLLISLRYFTVMYVAAVLGVLFLLFVWSALRSNSGASDSFLARTRARNLIASAFIVTLIVGPLLFASRHQIYAYYGVGHVLGEEKYIWAHALELFTFLDHVLFYPKSIAFDHLGWLAMALGAFVLALAVGAALLWMSQIILAKQLRVYRLDLAAVSAASSFHSLLSLRT